MRLLKIFFVFLLLVVIFLLFLIIARLLVSLCDVAGFLDLANFDILVFHFGNRVFFAGSERLFRHADVSCALLLRPRLYTCLGTRPHLGHLSERSQRLLDLLSLFRCLAPLLRNRFFLALNLRQILLHLVFELLVMATSCTYEATRWVGRQHIRSCIVT